MGNSGTGKSSMLRAVAGLRDKRLRTAPLSRSPAVHRRAVAGLWDRGSGDIARPHTADTMFLPQRPYCTLGSLRQQLVYPRTVDEWARGSSLGTDGSLLDALATAQLTRLWGGGGHWLATSG